jgi:hypothetical protein
LRFPRFSGVFEDWFDLADQTPTTATPPARPSGARSEGVHAWGLFGSEMRESWNLVIGPALGV